MRRYYFSPLLSIFAIAFLFRLAVIFTLGDIENPPVYEYGIIADNIVKGNGFAGGAHYTEGIHPTAFKAPLYPYFLAAAYNLFGPYRFLAIEIIQAFIGALTAVVIYNIALKIYDKSTALLAGLLTALYPIHAYLTQEISPVIFFSFFISMLILLLIDLSRRWSVDKAVICGLHLGVTALLNSAIIVFVPFVALWFFMKFKALGNVEVIKRLSIIIAVCFAVVLPWTIRNYLVFKRIIPIKSQIGLNLWRGNNRFATGTYVPAENGRVVTVDELLLTEKDIAHLKSLNEVERYRYLGQETLKYMARNPGRTIALTFKKFCRFWYYPTEYSRLSFHGKEVSRFPLLRNIVWAPFLLTGIAGIWLSVLQKKDVSLILMLLAAFSILYSFTVIYPQYRRPIEPEVCMFSAYAIITALRKLCSGDIGDVPI